MVTMMNTTGIRHCLIGLLLAAFIAGCGGAWNKESTGEYVDNTVLTTKVKTAIFNDPMLKVLQINVESFKGVVQLSGFVDSKKAADRAVEIARSVTGVKSVKNDLVIK